MGKKMTVSMRKFKLPSVLLTGIMMLTGCVSADVLMSSATMEARGPGPQAPQPRLGTGHQAPELADRRGFDPQATVVSLTFDDGNASQLSAIEVMDELDMEGTFFVNSSVLDTEGYLSLEQLDQMVVNGHEIGGHGVQHRNLAELDIEEAQRQICLDRKNLVFWGYHGTSFAYPEAGTSAAVEEATQLCGYNSARGLGNVASVIDCEECRVSESFTPDNPMHTNAPAMVDNSWRAQDMKNLVLNAEEDGGGWVQVTYHHVCPGACNELAVDLEDFEEFATWLKKREEATGTVVRTVDEVIGGEQQPVVDVEFDAVRGEGNLVINSGFDRSPHADGVSRCWQSGSYGTNTGTASIVNQGNNASAAIQLEVADYIDGDFKFLQRLDLGECATDVVTGARYRMKADYKSTTSAQFVAYLRDERGDWLYWTASPWLEPSDELAESVWIAPHVPEGFTGIAFGMSLFSDGTLVADDVEMTYFGD